MTQMSFPSTVWNEANVEATVLHPAPRYGFVRNNAWPAMAVALAAAAVVLDPAQVRRRTRKARR